MFKNVKWNEINEVPKTLYYAVPRECFKKEECVIELSRTFNIFLDDLYDCRRLIRMYYMNLMYITNKDGIIEENNYQEGDYVVVKLKPVLDAGVRFEKAEIGCSSIVDNPMRNLTSVAFELIDVFKGCN